MFKDYKKITAIISFVFCLIFTASVYGSDMEKERFKKAADLISRGHYLEAAGLYNELSEDGSSAAIRAEALLFSGAVYDLYLGHPGISLKLFKKIYTSYPETSSAAEALFISGRILYQMEKYSEAYAIFRRYAETYPKDRLRRSTSAWLNNSKKNQIASSEEIKKEGVSFDKTIRVMLKKDTKWLVFSSPEKIRISSLKTGKTVYVGSGPVFVTKKERGLLINTEKISARECIVETAHDYLRLGGKPYRGKFFIHNNRRGLTAVNHLHIEKYLYGVVPKEMSWLWSEEALKAQAIASRTYALYTKTKQSVDKKYDLSATISSQVYGGYDSEKEQASKAVDATYGKVMVHNGNLIISYFHANSGGRTESPGNVWGNEISYLKSFPDSYSSVPETRRWQLAMTFKELSQTLKKAGINVGKINRLKVEGRSASGRIKAFRIFSDKGEIRLSGNNFRLKTDPVALKSTWFNIKSKGNQIVFEGRGYGHGVGMSQWGAHQMGLAGYSHEKILKHYYRGVDIKRAVYR